MVTLDSHIDLEDWESATSLLKSIRSIDGIEFWFVFSLRTGYLINKEVAKLELVDQFLRECLTIGFEPKNIPQAVSLRDNSYVCSYLAKGHDVDEKEFCNATGLTIAVLQQDLEMVNLLLKKGASNYSEDSQNNKPIDYAEEGSDIFILLKHSGVLTRKETEEIMDDYYNDVDFANDFRFTQMEFMEGAAKGEIERMAKALVRPKGIWILNGTYPVNGKTALHLATENNNIDAIKFLLAKGIDKNKCDFEGLTPLDIATRLNLTTAISLLSPATSAVTKGTI